MIALFFVLVVAAAAAYDAALYHADAIDCLHDIEPTSFAMTAVCLARALDDVGRRVGGAIRYSWHRFAAEPIDFLFGWAVDGVVTVCVGMHQFATRSLGAIVCSCSGVVDEEEHDSVCIREINASTVALREGLQPITDAVYRLAMIARWLMFAAEPIGQCDTPTSQLNTSSTTTDTDEYDAAFDLQLALFKTFRIGLSFTGTALFWAVYGIGVFASLLLVDELVWRPWRHRAILAANPGVAVANLVQVGNTVAVAVPSPQPSG